MAMTFQSPYCNHPDRFYLSIHDSSLFSQAAQIMNGVIYYALGYLCYALFLQEEKRESTGSIPVIVTIVHIFWSSPFVSKP